MKHIEKFINEFEKMIGGIHFHEIERYGTNPLVRINNEDFLMFASNNYLSLSNDPRVIDAARVALELNGMGPGGSRFLCGNLKILNDLEKCISEFVGVEDCITFPTGYMANLAAISAMIGSFIKDQPHNIESAIIFSDENNHATLADGIKISKANKIIYPHLNYEFLENELNKHKHDHPKLIVTESVYPMDGDIADLNKIADLAKKYDALLMVDDAHGVGILGENGGGALEHFNLHNKVDVIMGSMDKALGGMGGYLGGSKKLIKYLRVASRPYIFSSSMSAVMAGGMIKSIEICQKEKNRRKDLFEKADYVREKLTDLGYKLLGSNKIPVAPLLIGSDENCNIISKYLFSKKIFCPSIVWPAVPINTARMRITIMHEHTKEQLDYLIKTLEEARSLIKISK
jgi:glycine C-acetyltransferase